ncbi:MAG TPA: DUF4260 domain-containing protein [Edaphobacter sp.]|jgi:hypothetical protein|nr:DUF4260 domain-containing protein [Edaphobacter sp.]
MLTRPSLLLRLEEATLFAAALFLYYYLQCSWLLFAVLFLTPDLFMVGYAINSRVGAASYNLVHTLIFPVILLSVGYLLHQHLAAELALIWVAHIALDRLLGYGLKYATFFKDTHLQHIPSRSQAAV